MTLPEYMRLTDAAKEYGISRNKLWILVRDGQLEAYEDPKDRRVTLLRTEDIEKALRVRPK